MSRPRHKPEPPPEPEPEPAKPKKKSRPNAATRSRAKRKSMSESRHGKILGRGPAPGTWRYQPMVGTGEVREAHMGPAGLATNACGDDIEVPIGTEVEVTGGVFHHPGPPAAAQDAPPPPGISSLLNNPASAIPDSGSDPTAVAEHLRQSGHSRLP